MRVGGRLRGKGLRLGVARGVARRLVARDGGNVSAREPGVGDDGYHTGHLGRVTPLPLRSWKKHLTIHTWPQRFFTH